MYMKEIWWQRTDWINVIKNRDEWRPLLIAVPKRRVL
jgi:hypothetical protein